MHSWGKRVFRDLSESRCDAQAAYFLWPETGNNNENSQVSKTEIDEHRGYYLDGGGSGEALPTCLAARKVESLT